MREPLRRPLARLGRTVRTVVRERTSGEPTAERLPIPPRAFVDDDRREIRVRPCAPDGRDDVEWDDVESLVAMYADFDPAQLAQGTPPVGADAVSDWLDDVLNDLSLVAVHGDRVVGHVMFVPDEQGAFELAVFVHQDYQRAGIGSALVRTGLGHARERGVSDVWLSVGRWRWGPQTLYRRAGFDVEGPTGPELRMARRLE